MTSDIFPLVTYLFVGIFSPGPNNISSACMGVIYGYGPLIPFLMGISTGFVVIMLFCASFCTMALENMFVVQTVIRWLGVCFILWLAYKQLFIDYNHMGGEVKLAEFKAGFCLQMMNVKTVVFGINIFSTFLSQVRHDFGSLLLSVLAIGMVNFVAVSFWSYCGSMLRHKLANPVIRQNTNRILALLMVYIAIELSGIIDVIV